MPSPSGNASHISQSWLDLVGRAGDDDGHEVGAATRAIRVRCAPSVPSRRMASSTTRPRTCLRVVQRGDPGGDVAQRAFGLGASGEGDLRASQLLDEPGVGDGDGGLLGQRPEERGVERVERVRRCG